MIVASVGFLLLGAVLGVVASRWLEGRDQARRDARSTTDTRTLRRELEQRKAAARSVEERMQALVKIRELENKRLQEQLMNAEIEGRQQIVALQAQLESLRTQEIPGLGRSDDMRQTIERLREQEDLANRFRKALLTQESEVSARAAAWKEEKRQLVHELHGAREAERKARSAIDESENTVRDLQRVEREAAARVRAMEKLLREFQERMAEKDQRIAELEQDFAGTIELLTQEREWRERVVAAPLAPAAREEVAVAAPAAREEVAEPALVTARFAVPVVSPEVVPAAETGEAVAPEPAGPDDDLAALPGIGPAAVKKLHAAGIRRYTDIAARSGGELADLLGLKGKKRDNFVGGDIPAKAARLAAAPPPAAAVRKKARARQPR